MLTPGTNPQAPEDLAALLMQADNGTFSYRGTDQPIGMLRKVLRWAFEMQGAYRQGPPPGPNGHRQPGFANVVGNPPDVDVFINDGRDGHYNYVANALHSPDVWNRHQPDNGTVHQLPVENHTNQLFVRVSNRGLNEATDVTVRAFQSARPDSHSWPSSDWEPLTLGQLALRTPIPSGSDSVVGPFHWTPASSQPAVLVAVSAAGDSDSLSRFSAASPIDNAMLVPLDNNLAQRTMATMSQPTDVNII